MSKKKSAIMDELLLIQKRHKGKLRPCDVVDFARNPETALHGQFCWDDTEAAQKWRLHQARDIIRVQVTIIKTDTPPVRAFVSLKNDRKTKGGGYRDVNFVVQHPDLSKTYARELYADAQDFIRKYENFNLAAGIVKEMRKLMTEMEAMPIMQEKPTQVNAVMATA